MNTADCEDSRAAIREAVRALSEHLEPGSLIVLGCSTSEIAGGRIGLSRVGEANLVLAYSRLPYIGGSRAVYE